MEKIKLVIWDLDETFWKGTLSEEGIEPKEENIKLIKVLVDRGIMNSIASKNNFDEAKRKLKELEIWDYFIFPRIDWLPKGQLVKNIIEEAQLRPQNVLFLDDNHLNLEEVEFYNKGIYVRSPEFISKILKHEAFKGKDDRSHSRLSQYRILEKKSEKSKLFSNNNEFLEFSEIKIRFSSIEENDIQRIHELIERTNQLNFTKKRDSIEELNQLLNDKNISANKIEVWDKFGDYGIVGFYMLNKNSNELIHFVFSCRTMNIGVEQYVYEKLNYPIVNIVGDVATTLKMNEKVTWIEEVSNNQNNNSSSKCSKVENKLKLLLKGGCDLGQMIHYLQYKNIQINTEFNDVNAKNIPLHKEHTVFCCDAYNENFYSENINQLEYITFVDETFYKTEIYSGDYDILVYSLLMDYTQDIYESKTKKVKIGYGGYRFNLIEDEEYVLNNITYLNKDFLTHFKKDYDYIGQISPEGFKKNLEFIVSKVKKPIIFINGAELNPHKSLEIDADKRHHIMNLALDEFISQYDNVYLLDIRKIVTDYTMLEDNIRHYKREVYSTIAKELINITESISSINAKQDILKSGMGKLKHFLKKDVKDKLKNLVK